MTIGIGHGCVGSLRNIPLRLHHVNGICQVNLFLARSSQWCRNRFLSIGSIRNSIGNLFTFGIGHWRHRSFNYTFVWRNIIGFRSNSNTGNIFRFCIGHRRHRSFNYTCVWRNIIGLRSNSNIFRCLGRRGSLITRFCNDLRSTCLFLPNVNRPRWHRNGRLVHSRRCCTFFWNRLCLLSRLIWFGVHRLIQFRCNQLPQLLFQAYFLLVRVVEKWKLIDTHTVPTILYKLYCYTYIIYNIIIYDYMIYIYIYINIK